MLFNDIFCFETVNDTDMSKVKALADSIAKNGWIGAPILVDAEVGKLITGSHRFAALKFLDNDGFDCDNFGDVAEDVSGEIEDYFSSHEYTGFDYGDLRQYFEGTWVEAYKEQIREW